MSEVACICSDRSLSAHREGEARKGKGEEGERGKESKGKLGDERRGGGEGGECLLNQAGTQRITALLRRGVGEEAIRADEFSSKSPLTSRC